MGLCWSIKTKLWLCVAILFAIVAVLSFSGFRAAYAYRDLARSVSTRAAELPLAGALSHHLGDLRVTLSRARGANSNNEAATLATRDLDLQLVKHSFRENINSIEAAIKKYHASLAADTAAEQLLGDRTHELATLDAIATSVTHVARYKDDPAWILDQFRVESVASEVDEMYELSNTLPQHLHTQMHSFAGQVKSQYRTWIILAWATSILTGLMLSCLLFLLYRWVLQPLQLLIAGSRIIGSGNFSYQVELASQDEMAELARALNDMTNRFRVIRDDLDRQVKERTQEALQSEQLASVGFLAAGVAHEINNPLASIAWAAESLEGRVGDVLETAPESEEAAEKELAVIRKYLRCIQDEAFRCKGITEKLLDFSRMGDMQKHETNMTELVQGVTEMVRHLGKYRQKKIEFNPKGYIVAPVEAQQMKQVVLNLITNALDSLDPGGVVTIDLEKTATHAELVVRDNGCGMTEEVKQHLFQPFFTRRRDGSGTGLGLSITFRIIQDHGGTIRGESDGPGKGSTFRVSLPLVTAEKGNHANSERQEKRLQAA